MLKNALKESLLCDNVLNKKLICDIYCLSSHFDYTTYVQIYADDKAYFLLYARTFVADYLGLKSNCQTFDGTQEADAHTGKVGKVICGMKMTPKSNSVIKDILSVIPIVSEEKVKNNIILDEYFTYIKYHEADKELSFRDASHLKSNTFSEEQVNTLNSLYKLITSV